MCLLGEVSTPLQRMLRSSLQPMWDLITHPLGPNVLGGARSLLQSMWDPPIHSPLWPSVLTGTLPRVHPLSGLSLHAGTSPSI